MFNDFQVSLKTPLSGTVLGDNTGRICRRDLSEDEVAPTFLKPLQTHILRRPSFRHFGIAAQVETAAGGE